MKSKLKVSKKNSYRGFQEEKLFCLCIKEFKGYECRTASMAEDRYKHIDVFISNGMSVDVKAQKKINNSDKEFNQDYTWVELENVNGFLGWLNGTATHIAYAFEDHYKIFHRQSLRDFVYSKINEDKWRYKTFSPEPYVIYRRGTLKDKIVLIPLKDMLAEVPYLILRRDEELLKKS
jgi:hypothetical protein